MENEKAIRWLTIIGRDVITLEEPYRSEAVEAITIAIQAIRRQQEGKDDEKEE